MTTPMRPAPFVGRERELRILLARLDAAGDERGSCVLVGGEPGIGKTRLLLELARRASGDGRLVLAGRAYESESMPAYLPFVESLRGRLQEPPEGMRSGSDGAGAPAAPHGLGQWLPALVERSAGASDYDRYRMFEGVTDTILDIARRSECGVLLWLDDLHWADQPALLLLLHLLRRLAGQAAPLLVAGTYRTVDLGRGHRFLDFLADAGREQLADLVLLQPLSLEETGHLAGALTGAPVSDQLVTTLHRETAGNAFYVTEMVRDLCDEQAGPAGLTALPPGRVLPRGVRQVIDKRLARLHPDTVRVLQAAAVLGDGCAPELIARVSAVEGAMLLDALDEALLTGMLRDEGGRWYFAHAFISQALHQGMHSARRASLHHRALDALEQAAARGDVSALSGLAYHAVRAGLDHSDCRPVDHARSAAAQALGSLAFEEAIRLYQLALDEIARRRTPADEPVRRRIVLDLGRAQHQAGLFSAAMTSFATAFESARAAVDVEAMAEAATGYEDALLASGNARSPTDASVHMHETVLTAIGTVESAARVRLLAGLARALFFGGERARAPRLADEALALARRVGDDRALAAALHAHRITMWGPDALPQRLSVATELIRTADRTGDLGLALEGRQWRMFALLESGDTAGFDAELPAYTRLAAEIGQPLFTFKAEQWRHVRAIMNGHFDDAERFITRTAETARQTGSTSLLADATLMLLSIRPAQERAGEVVEQVRDFVHQHPELPVWRFILAHLLAEAGHMGEARARFEELAANDFAGLAQDYFLLIIFVYAAETCVRLGDRARAAVLYERLAPYRDRVAVLLPVYHGAVAGRLGLLATLLSRWDQAEADFELAVRINRTALARWRLARTLTDYAGTLLGRPERRQEQRGRARALLDEALALYDTFGSAQDARARRLLADPRLAGAPALRPSYPDGLTEREVEVLRLLAAGLTSRRIADTLVLSERTVERHIEKLYAKTGAHGRAEATRYALLHRLA